MAYVLGYIYADGCIYKASRGSYLSVTSTDKQTIKKIKKWMSSQHTIYVSNPVGIGKKQRYILRIGSQKIYMSLEKLGVYPSKSLTVSFPKIPREYLSAFILGYFDGDGCVYLYRTLGRKGKLIIRKLSVIFTSGSKVFLEGLLSNLRQELSLRQQKIYPSRTAYQLRFSTKDSVVLFNYLYGTVPSDLYLKRKYAIFQQYFSLKKA